MKYYKIEWRFIEDSAQEFAVYFIDENHYLFQIIDDMENFKHDQVYNSIVNVIDTLQELTKEEYDICCLVFDKGFFSSHNRTLNDICNDIKQLY
jgi:hypothetical protein